MYKLYGTRGAGSDVIEMLLKELGQPYEFISLAGEARQAPEFLKINPQGRIPALILADGRALLESAAMVIHLTTIHPSALAPKPGTPEHASFMQWLIFLSANIYEADLRYFYPARFSADGESAAPGIKEQAQIDMLKLFGQCEQALNPGLVGKTITAADYYLLMLASWYPPNARALYQRYPKLAALAKTVMARPAAADVLGEAA